LKLPYLSRIHSWAGSTVLALSVSLLATASTFAWKTPVRGFLGPGGRIPVAFGWPFAWGTIIPSVLSAPPQPPGYILSLNGFALDLAFWFLTCLAVLRVGILLRAKIQEVTVEKEVGV